MRGRLRTRPVLLALVSVLFACDVFPPTPPPPEDLPSFPGPLTLDQVVALANDLTGSLDLPFDWPSSFAAEARALLRDLFDNYEDEPCDTTDEGGFAAIHDCQRLVVLDSGVRVFGPTVGIVPSDSLVDGDFPDFATPRKVAKVVNWGYRDFDGNEVSAPYTPLGILDGGTWSAPTTQCLWLWDDAGTWDAALTSDCTVAPIALDPAWNALRVVRQAHPTAADYPQTTRWLWTGPDPMSLDGEHYFGVGCADRWCAILRDDPGVTVPAMLPAGRVERTIPGWYDAQFLGVEAAEGLVPGPWGTVYPRQSGLYEFSEYVEWFRPEANVVLRGAAGPTGDPAPYARRYRTTDDGFESTVVVRAHELPIEAWYKNASVPNQNFPASVRHELESHGRLGSARFRWSADDETVWVPCAYGCCDVGWAFE